jgi:hypothetical protein
MSITKAILSLRPGSEFTLSNMDDFSTIVWHTEVEPLTEQEVIDEMNRLAQEKVDKKEAAEAKLQALGLTVEDIKALLS